MDTVLLADNEITALEFCDPYPILVSASANGSVNVWAMNGSPADLKHKCILKLWNCIWKDNVEVKVPITSLCAEYGSEMQAVRREPVVDTYKPPPQKVNDPLIDKNQTQE